MSPTVGRYVLIGVLVAVAVAVFVAGRRRRGLGLPALRRRTSADQRSLTVAVLSWLLVALVVAAASGAALLWAFGWPRLPSMPAFDPAQTLDLVRIVLTVVAGIGGVVLLAVNMRKQRVTEAEHDLAVARAEREREQGFNERFGTAAEQLAHGNAAVRLAGAYAMAGLADEWSQAQVCVDVLCGYLRLPPPADGDEETQVRNTILRLIRERARDRWSSLDFDFTGVEFEDADFSGGDFSGTVVFDGAKFAGSLTSFRGTTFAGRLSCHGTVFESTETSFAGAEFHAAKAEFVGARFAGDLLSFENVTVDRISVDFYRCDFALPLLDFSLATISSGVLRLQHCELTRATLDFSFLNDSLWNLTGFPRVTLEDCRLTQCLIDLRWSGQPSWLWWLDGCRLEQVEFKTGHPDDTGKRWLNVRDVELVATELPERCVNQRGAVQMPGAGNNTPSAPC
ncbi:MAG TPA: hypothetical protein VHC18_23830 [Amycolatopsis sp.]|nr:hypothetical protein [Amycolatopsis sp.]